MEAKTYSIRVMREEHENILEFLKVVRSACIRVMNGERVDEEDFFGFIDFARNYSDKHHHGKEEKFLFNEMSEHLGSAGKNLVQAGMLVEHDLCRGHILDLEMALNAWKDDKNKTDSFRLDIIEAAAGYANLLSRHIEKENAIVYPFAERGLSTEILCSIDEKVKEAEEDKEKSDKRDNLLKKLSAWKEKYAIL